MPAPKPHRPSKSRRGGRWACIALAFAVFFGLPLAPPARAGPEEAARELQLEVFLNGETRHAIASFTDLPGRGLAATRKELKEVGIKPPDEGADEDLIPLAGLPDVTYQYDEPRQRVDIALPHERRMPHVIDARGGAKRLESAQAGYGAVLNYTLFGSSVTQVEDKLLAFTGASAQLDGRVFTPLGYLQQTGIVGTTLNREVNVLRLDTTLAHSDPDTAITYRAGDAISRGPLWARPIRFGGLQIERNFALRPDLITAPLPAVSGSAAVPSTVEVFVDNLRTFSRQVPAGPYNVTNLPVMSGSGTARVVLRDASGREVETSLPFFASPQLLGEGFVDFSVQAGYPRQAYAVEADLYSDKPFASAGVRYGLVDTVTLEAHGEVGADLFNGGAGLVTNAGALGVFSVAGRASQHQGETGFQAYASMETRILGLTFGASTQRSFGAFEDIASLSARPGYGAGTAGPLGGYRRADPTFVDPMMTGSIARSLQAPRALDRVSVGIPIPALRASLGVSFINLERQEGDRSRVVAASYSQTIGKNISVSVNLFGDLDRPKEGGVFASLSMPIGDDVISSVGAASNRNGAYATADASKSLKPDVGSYGWRVRDVEGIKGSQGGQGSYRAAGGSYRSSVARLDASVEQIGRGGRLTGEVDGAIAVTRSGVFMANRVDDSFAIVDVGAPDVEVFHENRSVGKTGSRGKILVPQLRSYQRNRVRIDPINLPVDAHIGRTDEIVVPGEKTGVDLDFGVEAQSRSAMIVLHDAGGRALNAGLRGRREGAGEAFIVGYDGRSYLRGLDSSNTVIVELPEGECRATFDYAPEPGRQVVIGPLQCLQPQPSSSD